MRTRNSYSRILQNVHNWGGKFQKAEIIRLLHHRMELDITSYSLNSFYGKNLPERRFGTALSESGLSRDKIQLIAQITDAQNIQETVDELLLYAKSDFLDLVLFDADLDAEELIPAVELLRSRGKIMEIGAINLRYPEKDLLHDKIPIMANLFKWPDPSAETGRDLNLNNLNSRELTAIAWCSWGKAYAKQLFAQDPENLETLCRKYGMDKEQLITAWLLAHPAHIHPLITESNEKRIAAISEAQKVSFEQEDWLLLQSRIENQPIQESDQT